MLESGAEGKPVRTKLTHEFWFASVFMACGDNKARAVPPAWDVAGMGEGLCLGCWVI